MTKTMSADSTRRPLSKALKIKNPNPDVLRFIEAEALSKTRMDLARSNQITACCACLVRQVSLSPLRVPQMAEFMALFDDLVYRGVPAMRFLRSEATGDHPYDDCFKERKQSEPVMAGMNGNMQSFQTFVHLVASTHVFRAMYGMEYVAPLLQEAKKQLGRWETEWATLDLAHEDFPEGFSLHEVAYVLGKVGAFTYRALFYQSQRPGGLAGGTGGSVYLSTRSSQQLWRECHDFADVAVRCGTQLSPPLPGGHVDLIWCFSAAPNIDFVKVAHHAKEVVALADALQDDFSSAVGRWELAFSIIFGAEGKTFKRGRIAGLMQEAETCEARLKLWNQHKKVRVSSSGCDIVEEFITLESKGKSNGKVYRARAVPVQDRLKPQKGTGNGKGKRGTGKNTTKGQEGGAAEEGTGEKEGAEIGSLEQPHRCHGCRRHFKEVKKCSRCGIARYHSAGCFRSHWKVHKLVCTKKS